MNIKILTQNIVNNPSDFTIEQIEKYFEDYAELRLSAVSTDISYENLENLKRAILDVSHWEDFINIEESKLSIPYFELKRIIINRIMFLHKIEIIF
jgi:hypothetical protein